MTDERSKETNRSGTATLDLVAARRAFLGTLGMGAAGAVLFGGRSGGPPAAQAAEVTDTEILNFALNLEYLEGEYYNLGATGVGLSDNEVTGKGNPGPVKGGRKVDFATKALKNYAVEIAGDEKNHVDFLRSTLGGNAVARPAISFTNAFNAASQAAGLGQTFDAFASEENFFLGAFLLTEVGVTAYNGAAPLIKSKTVLASAASLLAVEAYHAGIINTVLYSKGLFLETHKISNARDRLDGKSDDDQGIGNADIANLVPADSNSLAFARTPQQVLNIAYLDPQGKPGGFFPAGVNGNFRFNP